MNSTQAKSVNMDKLCTHIADRSRQGRQDLRCSRQLNHNPQDTKHYHVIPIGWGQISEERNIKIRGLKYGEWDGKV